MQSGAAPCHLPPTERNTDQGLSVYVCVCAFLRWKRLATEGVLSVFSELQPFTWLRNARHHPLWC